MKNSKEKDPLSEKLQKLREDQNITQQQMAENLGIGYRTYQEIEKTGVIKKSDVLSKILLLLKDAEFSARMISLESELKTSKLNTSESPTTSANDYTLKTANKDLTMQAIMGLIESNKALSFAHQKDSESKERLTRGNERLINMLEKAIVNVEQQNQLTVESRFSDLLGLIAEVGSGKHWKSKSEALVALNKLVFDNHKKKKEVGSRSEKDKSNRV